PRPGSPMSGSFTVQVRAIMPVGLSGHRLAHSPFGSALPDMTPQDAGGPAIAKSSSQPPLIPAMGIEDRSVHVPVLVPVKVVLPVWVVVQVKVVEPVKV